MEIAEIAMGLKLNSLDLLLKPRAVLPFPIVICEATAASVSPTECAAKASTDGLFMSKKSRGGLMWSFPDAGATTVVADQMAELANDDGPPEGRTKPTIAPT